MNTLVVLRALIWFLILGGFSNLPVFWRFVSGTWNDAWRVSWTLWSRETCKASRPKVRLCYTRCIEISELARALCFALCRKYRLSQTPSLAPVFLEFATAIGAARYGFWILKDQLFIGYLFPFSSVADICVTLLWFYFILSEVASFACQTFRRFSLQFGKLSFY